MTKLERAVQKAIMDFVEKGQSRIISIKYTNGEVIIDGDEESVNELLNSPSVEDVKSIVTKVLKTIENKNTKEDTLPKLKAPLDLENEEKGWTSLKMRDQMKIYLTILKWKSPMESHCGGPAASALNNSSTTAMPT